MAAPPAWPTTLTSSGTAVVNDIIAPLHFAHDPMQQAGSDRFVPAKLRRDVLNEGIAVGLRVWRLASTGQIRERAVAVAIGPSGVTASAPH